MEAADSLIKSLASEKIRWSKQSNEINETLQQAIGNAAVASGFISYVLRGEGGRKGEGGGRGMGEVRGGEKFWVGSQNRQFSS